VRKQFLESNENNHSSASSGCSYVMLRKRFMAENANMKKIKTEWLHLNDQIPRDFK
jgi:spore coat polysaccharide biosynthesis predicted glycosyltransferase SpsG